MASQAPQNAQVADRGRIGQAYRAPTLEDESYLDFMTGVRNLAIREMFPEVAQTSTAAAEAAGIDDVAACEYSDFSKVADELPLVRVWKRIMRSQQQLTWNKIQESCNSRRNQHESELAEAETRDPEGLSYDPDFVTPDYASYPIHLQPGGYVGDTLAGYVFDHGTRVFYQGDNQQDELHAQVVDELRVPDDGKVERILDVGCSIGQCTTVLAERFPKAEVTGLDVGLPMVRYAHRRAVDLGSSARFVQGLAEELPYPDGHFDAVLAYILFHEVPARLFPRIVAEVFRVLRPGGTFTVVDAPNDTHLPGPNRMWLAYDAQYNCEPYSPGFVACDFVQLLTDAGFESIEQHPTPTFLSGTTCNRPAE